MLQVLYCLLVLSLELRSDDVVYPCAQLEAEELSVFEELRWSITPEIETKIQQARENLITCVLLPNSS